MTKTFLSVTCAIGAAFIVSGYFLLVVLERTALKDALTFTNTAAWEPELVTISLEPTIYPGEKFSNITLPPPPQNSSKEAADEIALLKSYEKDLRTPERINEILIQRTFATNNFGGHTVATYMDPSQFPATALLLRDSMHDLDVIMLREKRKFNRVRPNELDRALQIVIPVPGHPAYPSGHSTEMHFLAYVLSELAPARKEEFVAYAGAVAKNREVAGLHYPSDSQAGMLLAQQVFAVLSEDPKFQQYLAAAKEEWLQKK